MDVPAVHQPANRSFAWLNQLLEETHPELTASKTADDRIQVVKMDEAARLAFQKAAAEEDLKKYEAAMGMRLVFNDLVVAKKPLVRLDD